MGVHYASGAGHNVLQVGTFFPDRPYPVQSTPKYPGWQRPDGIAPIHVQRLDATGGLVVVDANRCYAETDRWVRRVDWTSASLTVRDEVTLEEGGRDILMFRWHLGTTETLAVTGSDDAHVFTVQWSDARMLLAADQAVEVQSYKAPDATVTGKQDHQHMCVRVQTRAPANALRIVTTIQPMDP